MAGKLKIVYHVKKEEGRDKPFWNRVGKAFTNKDGNSLSVLLDYIPPSEDGTYRFQIRDYEPKEKKEANTFEE